MKDDDGLKVLQAVRDFRDRVQLLLAKLPKGATFGLRSQLGEVARSVSSNNFGRIRSRHPSEELHFFRMANGSLEESQEGLREFVNARLITRQVFYSLWNLSVAISKMLVRLIAKWE